MLLFADDPGMNYRILCKLTGQLLHFLQRLWNDGVTPVFFFDGPPHPLKQQELNQRATENKKKSSSIAELYQQETTNPGSADLEKLYKMVVQYPYLPYEYVTSIQNTLTMLGVPWVTAVHDGEQLAARCCAEGLISAVWSNDSDNLIFGAPLVIKGFVTGQPKAVEVVCLGEILKATGFTQAQHIDLAILLGCDFNQRIRGIGRVKAMELIRQYHCLENVQGYDLTRLNYHAVREIFNHQPSGQPEWQLTRDRFSQLGEYIYQLVPEVNKNNLIVAHHNVPLAQNGHVFDTLTSTIFTSTSTIFTSTSTTFTNSSVNTASSFANIASSSVSVTGSSSAPIPVTSGPSPVINFLSPQ